MTLEAILKKKKVYFIMLALALWFGCTPSPSFALPVYSGEQGIDYNKDRDLINSFLVQEAVSKRLAGMGLSQEDIESRLDKLSDRQIHQLAENLERIKAGGSGWAIALVVVLLFVGLVLFFLTHTVHVEPKEEPLTK